MSTLADYKAPYPEPTADQKRYVIYLEPKEEEDMNYKVELIPGRIENVDSCNNHTMGGSMKEESVKGWGYSYHVVTLGPTAGTLMMAFGEAAERKPRFVGCRSLPFVRYNSKLPIVVYVPKNAELRYKIWSCGGDNAPVEGAPATEE